MRMCEGSWHVSGPRAIVYLVAIKTGLRRGELLKLEWRDVQLDGPEPFLKVRAATTKNGKVAPIPIDDELAGALRRLRGVEPRRVARLFESLPRMPVSGLIWRRLTLIP